MKRVLLFVLATFLAATPSLAQERNVTGQVTNEQGAPLQGATVLVKGTSTQVLANAEGRYTIRAAVGATLVFRFLGTASVERPVPAEGEVSVAMRRIATQLDATVVTALGQSAAQRALGYSQQVVDGVQIAQTQRENFINALQGRVAGVEVTSTSGVPGASASITIRGVSSISSSNQPLMVVDGLPIDNKTLNTNVLASDAPGSTTAFNNRGVDFTNRSSDLNPEDIETLVVLKGPEATALYGIDAANGAIVITTKRGRAGTGGFEYSNLFRFDAPRGNPLRQRVYGPSSVTGGVQSSFFYFGAPYPAGTTFYDNVDGFFQTAVTTRHNLAFEGAASDNRINYRFTLSSDKQEGVIPNSEYGRTNLTVASQAQLNSWLRSDVTMNYAYSDNEQPWKGDGGPLIGLLIWPQTDNASDWLTPAGTRRRITLQSAAGEVDNPYFSVFKNGNHTRTSRLITNIGFVVSPFSWGSLKTNVGVDGYTSELQLLRHPESALANSVNGILDESNDVVRNLNAQTILNLNAQQITRDISISGFVGNQVTDNKSTASSLKGQDFLDPNFVSVNNTNLRFNRTITSQRRLVSFFGSATADFRNYLYVTVTGRNDWTSTIPVERNSFFYPSVSTSFIFSDAFPGVAKYVTGKVRAAYAQVGKDARPYAFRPSLEFKATSFGGYGYGFTGPNLGLKPEFANSYEFGTELGFLQDRLGLDVTWYRKETKDQIVNDIRGPYATGFILFNLNGAVTRNTGLEITLRGAPVSRPDFSWDAIVNFEKARGRVLALPNALPESYVSDTWLYGFVRNGTQPGLSTRSLTGRFYARNNAGDLLIDPATGLPVPRPAAFIDAGYDRQPDFTIGLSNSFTYKKWGLDVLFDIRRGGDILNATEHYLTSRGLSMRTLDREMPRVIPGVLRDGKENTANPTRNTIVIIPAQQPTYYTDMSEELFIEEDINWIRLKDITLRYELPSTWFAARRANAFLTMTDLFVLTNYSGLDPIVNGNSAAVGGSGGAGIDYGNFPVPRGISFGLKVGY